MFWYLWTSAEAAPPITGEDEGMATGDREEDLLPGEMYLPQDMEAPLDVLIVEKKDAMCAIVPRRNSYPAMRKITGKPTSSIYRTKGNKTTVTTMKQRIPKNRIW